MTPHQKRQRAIEHPEYLNELFDRVRSGLSPWARIALGRSTISLIQQNDGFSVSDEWTVLLLLKDPWILNSDLSYEFSQLANALHQELDISEIGIYCKKRYWAAHLNPRSGVWLLISEEEFHEIEGEIATIVPEDPDRPCCIGWNCDWKDDCCKHLEYQKHYKAGTLPTAKTIEPDPEDCDHFESAISIDFTDIA